MSTKSWMVLVAGLMLVMVGNALAADPCPPATTTSTSRQATTCPTPVPTGIKTGAACPFNLTVAIPTGTADTLSTCGYSVRGASDALFGALKSEHDQIRQLLAQINDDKCASAASWTELRNLVLSHEAAEEETLYPVLELTAESQAQASLRLQQHAAAGAMIAQLDEIAVTDCRWMPRFNALRESLLDHMWAEENKTFPGAREAIAQAAFCSLYNSYATARQSALTSLSAPAETTDTTE